MNIQTLQPVAERVTVGRLGYLEKDLERSIVSDLVHRGYRVSTQVRTRWGFADIVISNPHCVIELKRNSSPESIWKAVGQVCFYAEQFPGVRKFIGAVGGIHPDMLPSLWSMGISEWTFGAVPVFSVDQFSVIERVGPDGMKRLAFIEERDMSLNDYQQCVNYWKGQGLHAINEANGYARRGRDKFSAQIPLPFPSFEDITAESAD